MGTSYLADFEESADGIKEFYLFFVLPAAFLSVSAEEICQQPPSDSPVKPADSPVI